MVLARDSLEVADQDMPLNSLGLVCVDLANGYPNSGYAPVALWKASRAFRAAGSYAEAIECGRALVDAYPEHDLAASALFHNALIFNDDMNNAASARFYLERLLEEYPSDSLASQAKAMKELVGLSDKELLKKISRRK
jgi:TolA-binding protein